jgi:hypothetical protein
MPSASQGISAPPPSLLALCSISVVPNPGENGALTGGPPLHSAQVELAILHPPTDGNRAGDGRERAVFRGICAELIASRMSVAKFKLLMAPAQLP